MNCPQCHEPVGEDQFGYGPWKMPTTTVHSLRSVAISCSVCGVFEIIEQSTISVHSVNGPIADDRNLRRLEKLIPSCRGTRRQAAQGAHA